MSVTQSVIKEPFKYPATVDYSLVAPLTKSSIMANAATLAPLSSQSGSLILFNRAAGSVVTLPAPVVGMTFEFLVLLTVTSNSYKVITDATGTKIAGMLTGINTGSSNAIAAYTADPLNTRAVTQAAAGTNATGGILGTRFTMECMSSGLWVVSGFILANGTVATPFANS